MMNILNGGAHADNRIDFQEFMVMPVGAPTFAEALRCGAEIFHALKSALHKAGLSTAVGDEGGFAPDIELGPRSARFHREGGRARRATRPATTSCWRWTCAASEYLQGRPLRAGGRGQEPDARRKWPIILAGLAADYPIASIEDGMAEDDWAGWKAADRAARRPHPAGRRRSVRDQREAAAKGIDDGIANSILIKVNQIGTLTETIDAVRLAQTIGLHRGHVAPFGRDRGFDHRRPRGRAGCGQIKTGSLARSDRTAKYNQLLRIEEELGRQRALYAGRAAFKAVQARAESTTFIHDISTKSFFSLAFVTSS